jgi:hypothetical protein
MNGTRDRFFRDPDETKTGVPTKDYSHLDVNKRQAIFRCHKEHRTRTQPPKSVSALAVPPPPHPTQGPPTFHIDPVAYTTMVTEIATLYKDKRVRSEPQVPLVHASLPSGNVCPHMPSDNGSMFSERPDP